MTMHDIFLGFSKVKKHFCHYMEGEVSLLSGSSFKMINKCIFNEIIRESSVKSRKIISRQTGRIELSSFKFI